MDETLNIFKEFHTMPPKEKEEECSTDPNGVIASYMQVVKIIEKMLFNIGRTH
jgi:hypothetical protein